MSDNLNIYSPYDVLLTITRTSDGLAHTVGGYSDGAMISVEPSQAAFSMYTSADNKSTLIYHPDNSAKIMVTLNQTSASNVNKLFTVLVKDANGRSMFSSPQAFIGQRPNASFSNSMQNREWTILCAGMEQYSGGNALLSPSDVASLELLGTTVEDRWKP